jgi:hypothetical protein
MMIIVFLRNKINEFVHVFVIFALAFWLESIGNDSSYRNTTKNDQIYRVRMFWVLTVETNRKIMI